MTIVESSGTLAAETGVASARRGPRGLLRGSGPGSTRKKGRWAGWLFALPALAFYGFFDLYPVLTSIQYSFFNWDGIGASTPAGFSNYTAVFSTPELRSSLFHAFYLIIFFTALPVTFGLIAASVMRSIEGKFTGALARTVLFLPQIIPGAAAGVAWIWMYSKDGAVNQIFRLVGLGSITRPWLGDFTWALTAVGFIGTWLQTGFCTLLLMAGIGKIDAGLYEAARLDGAGPIAQFRNITLPGLRQEIGVCVTVTIISALASFDVVYLATQGGPGTQTQVPGVEVYNLAFNDGRLGAASAFAVVLALVVIAVIVPLQQLFKERWAMSSSLAEAPTIASTATHTARKLPSASPGLKRKLPGALLITIAGLYSIVPLISMLTAALAPRGTFPKGLSFPTHPHWHNFVAAFQTANITTLFKSSVLIVVGVVPVAVIISAMAAYAITLLHIPMGRAFYLILLMTLTLPFEIVIVPLYQQMKNLGLLNGQFGLILPLIGLNMPFAVFWMRAHFLGVPKELNEAADIDGAGMWQVFWHVQLPLARSALASLALLMFLSTWNQFLLPLVLINDPNKRTMAAALQAFQSRYSTDVVLLNAGALLLMAPTIIVFLLLQRHFVRALLQGSVKG